MEKLGKKYQISKQNTLKSSKCSRNSGIGSFDLNMSNVSCFGKIKLKTPTLLNPDDSKLKIDKTYNEICRQIQIDENITEKLLNRGILNENSEKYFQQKSNSLKFTDPDTSTISPKKFHIKKLKSLQIPQFNKTLDSIFLNENDAAFNIKTHKTTINLENSKSKKVKKPDFIEKFVSENSSEKKLPINLIPLDKKKRVKIRFLDELNEKKESKELNVTFNSFKSTIKNIKSGENRDINEKIDAFEGNDNKKCEKSIESTIANVSLNTLNSNNMTVKVCEIPNMFLKKNNPSKKAIKLTKIKNFIEINDESTILDKNNSEQSTKFIKMHDYKEIKKKFNSEITRIMEVYDSEKSKNLKIKNKFCSNLKKYDELGYNIIETVIPEISSLKKKISSNKTYGSYESKNNEFKILMVSDNKSKVKILRNDNTLNKLNLGTIIKFKSIIGSNIDSDEKRQNKNKIEKSNSNSLKIHQINSSCNKIRSKYISN